MLSGYKLHGAKAGANVGLRTMDSEASHTVAGSCYQRLQRPQAISKEHTLAGEWFNTAPVLILILVL